MSKKHLDENTSTKTDPTKTARPARKVKVRPLTLDELKDVAGGLLATCDSNGPPGYRRVIS